MERENLLYKVSIYLKYLSPHTPILGPGIHLDLVIQYSSQIITISVAMMRLYEDLSVTLVLSNVLFIFLKQDLTLILPTETNKLLPPSSGQHYTILNLHRSFYFKA